MDEAIKVIAAAYELPKSPKAEDVFSRAFLPPKADRVLPAMTN
jgi:NitT/TauT family transport system substrate-binding protein